MLTVLLKKQWMEMTASLRRSSVTGRVRTGWKAAAFLVLAACVALLVMGSVGALAALICQPLSDAGLDWLYFALMGAGALLAGVMGGGFTAYGILYLRPGQRAAAGPAHPAGADPGGADGLGLAAGRGVPGGDPAAGVCRLLCAGGRTRRRPPWPCCR